MNRLGFGAFLAPHHPIGEHPMLQFRRDLDLVEQLDGVPGRGFFLLATNSQALDAADDAA